MTRLILNVAHAPSLSCIVARQSPRASSAQLRILPAKIFFCLLDCAARAGSTVEAALLDIVLRSDMSICMKAVPVWLS